jgi:hypothetical protein
MPTLKESWRRAQHGWPARYPVAQAPNAPLGVALAAWVVGALTDGTVHDAARGVFSVALGAWAWEELTAGANAVRRGVGAAGFVYVVVRIADAVGG